MASGASKGAKKIDAFHEGNTKGVNIATGKIIKIPSVSPVEQIKSGQALDEKIRLERYEKKLKMMEKGRRKYI